MKLRTDINVNGRVYPKGSEVPWYVIYPFFLFHMLVFGGACFYMAYSRKSADLGAAYALGCFSILIYLVFYVVIFGVDEIKWMLINAGLGVLGTCSDLNWLLSFFGKRMEDYPLKAHVIPFLYFVMYTFLIRHAVLDLTQSRDDPLKKKRTERWYVAISLVIYVVSLFLERP